MAKIGLDCKLYVGTAGSRANSELLGVRDLTLDLTKGEADITTRGTGGWRVTIGTLKEATIDFELIQKDGDSGFSTVKDAYFNNTAIAIFASDDTGAGLDCDAVVTKFSRSEPLEDAVTYSVSLKPSVVGENGRNPAWVDGGSSSSSAASA